MSRAEFPSASPSALRHRSPHGRVPGNPFVEGVAHSQPDLPPIACRMPECTRKGSVSCATTIFLMPVKRELPGRRRAVGTCASCAEAAKEHPSERWPSGRRRTPGTRVGGKPSPGFESLSLRQPHFVKLRHVPSSGDAGFPQFGCQVCSTHCLNCTFTGLRLPRHARSLGQSYEPRKVPHRWKIGPVLRASRGRPRPGCCHVGGSLDAPEPAAGPLIRGGFLPGP